MAFDIHKYSTETFWGTVVIGLILLFGGVAMGGIRPWWAGCIAAMLIVDLGIYVAFAHFDPRAKNKDDMSPGPPIPGAKPLPQTEPIRQPAARPLTLREIFDTDFSNALLGFSGELSLRPAAGGKELQIRYRVLMDFGSLTKFLAFFLPSAPDAYSVCEFLAKNLSIPFDTASDSPLGNSPIWKSCSNRMALPSSFGETHISSCTGRITARFRRRPVHSQTRADPRRMTYSCAEFGTTDLPESWKDVTKSGENLAEKVKHLFKQSPNSIVISPMALDMDDPGGSGKKLLRMYVPGGKRKNLAAGMLLKWEDTWEA